MGRSPFGQCHGPFTHYSTSSATGDLAVGKGVQCLQGFCYYDNLAWAAVSCITGQALQTMCVSVRFRVSEQNRSTGGRTSKQTRAHLCVRVRAACVGALLTCPSLTCVCVCVRVRARACGGGGGMSAVLGSAASVCRSSTMARLFFLLFVARAIHCTRPPAAHSHF